MCIVVLAAAGICTWKFGPWSNDEKDTKTGDTYAALNTCDGCCNGLASNCALAVNEVLFPMVHNAHSSKADLFLAYNNRKSSEEALVAGFRGLMLDSCICDGSIGETLQNLWKEKDLVSLWNGGGLVRLYALVSHVFFIPRIGTHPPHTLSLCSVLGGEFVGFLPF